LIYSRSLQLDQFTPVALYHKLRKEYGGEETFLFESSEGCVDGNYSFIVLGAHEKVIHKDNETIYTDVNKEESIVDYNPFDFLKKYYSKIDFASYRKKSKELGIGFVDGFIGYIGFESAKLFEPILKNNMDALKDELDIADVNLIRPKISLIYSHRTHKITIITPFEENLIEIKEVEELIKTSYEYLPLTATKNSKEGEFTFSKEKFFEMVDRSKDMIKSGDVFQILMSNRYTQYAKIDPLSFYRILRTKNPSPYMYLLDFDDFSIAGSSPEVMIRLTDDQILLRPIAGTRKRGNTPLRDSELEDEMVNDPKERAEHLMLIDLGRNDVSRVAKTGTVKVTNMMHVEKYSHVMHMVSDVVATLDDKYDMFDLFAATFTAGTMTGAPKIRAMELIAEYEGIKRNFYSGSIGYFGFDGNMDSAITIRTALLTEDKIILQAGAGIVADSVNELEYLEVKNKLGALMSTLDNLKNI